MQDHMPSSNEGLAVAVMSMSGVLPHCRISRKRSGTQSRLMFVEHTTKQQQKARQ